MKNSLNILNYIPLALAAVFTFSSCKQDKELVPDIPPTDGTEMTLNGGEGGSAAENTVFVDLSAGNQTSVERTKWNLGFYNGEQFRVVLNNTAGSSAIKIDKVDLNAVSEADVNIEDLNISLGETGAFQNMDNLTGELNKTLIPELTSTGESTAVFVINPVGGSHGASINAKDLYKIKVLKIGKDYQLHYAKLNDHTFKTLTIQKDEAYDFQYFSFDQQLIKIAPKKTEWDFRWTWSLYPGGEEANLYPYGYSDLVFINHLSGVSAAEVIFEDTNGNNNDKANYASFSESDLSGIRFQNDMGVIGSNWRLTPSPTPGVVAGTRKDRFYLIKDISGNIYKLKFNSFTSDDAGKRGYPELEYKLVKRG